MEELLARYALTYEKGSSTLLIFLVWVNIGSHKCLHYFVQTKQCSLGECCVPKYLKIEKIVINKFVLFSGIKLLIIKSAVAQVDNLA